MVAPAAGSHLQRDHLDADDPVPAAAVELDAFLPNRLPLPASLLDCRPQLQGEPLAGHSHEVQARLSRPWFEVGAGPPAEMDDVEVLVDQHPRGSVLGEDDAIGLVLDFEVVAGRSSGGKGGRAPGGREVDRHEIGAQDGRGRLLGVDPVPAVEGHEHVRERSDGLGFAQQQESRRLERVMEDRDDALLEHRTEIDEDVAAADQVQP